MRNSRKSPKVVFISTMNGASWGGSEELWHQTALRLKHNGNEVGVSIYQWPDRPKAIENLLSSGVQIHFRPRKKTSVKKLIEKCRINGSKYVIDREYMLWLIHEDPDLVVVSQGGPWDGVPWMRACRELGLKYCSIIHGNSEMLWPCDEFRNNNLNGYWAAERVFFVSRANKDLMEMQCGIRFTHGEIIHNPLNINRDKVMPWPKEDGVTRLACVGRLEPKTKGHDVLLRVMALPKWRERPIHLSFYGTGPYGEGLQAMSRMLDLKNVSFEGHRSDVDGIWAENHALILASRMEGLPLVIIEAMFCGRPVITTHVAGNAEHIRDGITGFIAEAPTEMLVDEALERAWNARENWKSIGEAARQDIRSSIPPDPVGVFSEKLLEIAS